MAIIGLGMDLIEISRIKKTFSTFGDVFLYKIFTSIEYNNFLLKPSIASLAARFAAKEAASKALGTGFSNGITFKNIEISSLPNGKPQLHFQGNAKKKATTLGVNNIMITLTHSHNTAGAVVILET